MAVGGRAAAASLPKSAARGALLVENFRQPTDSDDTACIARAIAAARAAGGGRVIASAGRVYRVSPSTTFVSLNPSGGTCRYNVCVQLPPRVTLDMQGSTLQLQGTAEATILSNTNGTGSGKRDSHIGLVNAVLDGRNVPFTYHSLLHLAYIDTLTLNSVKIVRGVLQGGWIYNCAASVFDNLDADGFVGQPWTIGSPLGDNQVYDSQFGRLHARNVTALPGNTFYQPGNSFDLVLTRCSIDSIAATNCAAGIKLQWPGTDITLGSVTTDSCGDQNGNSGLKIQGDASGAVSRVRVGHVVARNQTGPGLFMEMCVDCSVESYSGAGNNKNGNMGDVWVGGTNDHVGAISSDASGGTGVIVRPYARGYRLPEVLVTNPGRNPKSPNNAGVTVFGGVGIFGGVICIDNQPQGTMSRGVDITSPTAVGSIASLTVSGQRQAAFNSVSGSFRPPKTLSILKDPTHSAPQRPSARAAERLRHLRERQSHKKRRRKVRR